MPRATGTVVRWRGPAQRCGVPDRNRTCNPQLRRLVLYPVELRALDRGGRSPSAAALVGVERFELPTSCSQSKRATRLRHTPRESGVVYARLETEANATPHRRLKGHFCACRTPPFLA